jgi:DNA invertase Pin-like site-specific DNA recombinase
MTTDALIAETMIALRGEGVDMAVCGEIEARMLSLLYRAQRIRYAESMLPLIGASATAERLNCSRATVYNLSNRSRKKSKDDAVALTG